MSTSLKKICRNEKTKQHILAGPKTINLNGLSEKTSNLVGIYNQQFQGTIIVMVFDLQGIRFFENKNSISKLQEKSTLHETEK